MLESTFHAAIIMDGNGRWALGRGLPRTAGHEAGADAVRRVVEAAPGVGIGILTLFAFSSDNWRRPRAEVQALMALLGKFVEAEIGRSIANGVKVEIIGRRDRLDPVLRRAIARAEAATAGGERLRLRIAVDYSGRDAILAAARLATSISRAGIERALGPAVDLLIRTGGEQRLSDFLLWECAYAELVFSRRLWPDFDAADLSGAVREFKMRQRRFGRVPEPAMNGMTPAHREPAWLD
jgi:undecaprenyl diphosphate synthase